MFYYSDSTGCMLLLIDYEISLCITSMYVKPIFLEVSVTTQNINMIQYIFIKINQQD